MNEQKFKLKGQIMILNLKLLHNDMIAKNKTRCIFSFKLQ